MGKPKWQWLLHVLVCFCHSIIIPAYPYFPRPRRVPEVLDYGFDPEENLHRNLGLPPLVTLSEGDIMVERRSRSAVRNYYETWINRTIPFQFENLNDQEQGQVRWAMQDIMSKSCVRFVPRNKELDFITIRKPTNNYGCSSSVGRRGGEQEIFLGEGCYVHGIILHELMHALGFWHEHSRPDRDDYIQVIWANILPQHHNNFDKYDNNTIDTLDTEYDYASIMHYKNNTFAMNRSFITINATRPLHPGVEMGQRVQLSETDILKIKRLYRCNITHCSNPGVPRSGVLVGDSYAVGKSVSYSCGSGYTLYGSRGRFCADTGQWTGFLPSCISQRGGLHMCNFDESVNSLCGWVPDMSGNVNWTRYTRATPSNGTGPNEDHTMGSDQGWYIYLETSGSFNVNTTYKAKLMSYPMITAPIYTYCLVFYYYMHGANMGTLNVYQRYMQNAQLTDRPVFTRTGEQGDQWNLGVVTLGNHPNITIVLEAVRGNGFLSDIAVDDVLVAPCRNIIEHLDPGEVTDTFKCTFDTDLCGMEQDFTDNFDWLRHSGQTTTFNTGPLCDPLLCSTGYYIYTESSRPRAAGEVTRISTPLLHGDGGRCLLFYWHMEGESVGSLRVWLRTLEGREVNIWSQTGNQTGGWHHEALDYVPSDFDNTTRFYKLVFEGTIGQSGTISFRGDIAIDNIEVLVGECSEVVRNDCTFQQDMCSWRNDPYTPGTLGRRDWVRTSGSTLTPGTGPTGTHNNMVNDYYMYVESSRTFRNDTARLISGRISGQVLGYCLQFFSHMFGPDIGTLSVLTQMESTRLLRQAWSLSGNHGDRWIRQAVYISSPGQEFRVIFQAVLTGGGLGDIAIDDITIHGGQCDTQ